ncbi:MAG: TRAP transporter small permease [Geminicoccaceae bacterium]|nr:TRAP transporter small permease [Geminicoccaceae bacterium]MCB2011473.1 TRAP transporter small permease [Geminicoccaceae bacterium]
MAEKAAAISTRLNWFVERFIAFLMIALVLDVWLGVVARYALRAQIPWTEELARYLMIWAALLAISAGIARREHIGFNMILARFPEGMQRMLLLAFDIIALGFFLFMLIYGIGMTMTGAKQFAMIFDMSMAMPYASVPVSSALAAIQLVLVAIRDRGRLHHLETREELV